MAKKVTISLLSLLLVGIVILGVYFYTQGGFTTGDKQKATSAIINEQYLDEDMSGEEYIVDTPKNEETQSDDNSGEFVPSDSDLADNTADIATTNFTIGRIVDHTTGEEVQGRVVFGSGFNHADNYIKFNQEGYFEIYLTGYLDEVTKGTYTEYDDIIYVEFEDGTAAEYDVKYTDSGIISHIMVNYGDYDVYFS